MVTSSYRAAHLALGPPLDQPGQGSDYRWVGVQGWGASSFPVSIQPQRASPNFSPFFLVTKEKENKTNCFALKPRQPTIFEQATLDFLIELFPSSSRHDSLTATRCAGLGIRELLRPSHDTAVSSPLLSTWFPFLPSHDNQDLPNKPV